MKTQEILTQLDSQIPDHLLQITALSPNEVAWLLGAAGDALISLINTTQGEHEDSIETKLSENKIQNIHMLFQELSQNFFPMAHTEDPLGQLRIYNESAIRDVGLSLRRAAEHFKEASRFLSNEVELRYQELSDR